MRGTSVKPAVEVVEIIGRGEVVRCLWGPGSVVGDGPESIPNGGGFPSESCSRSFFEK